MNVHTYPSQYTVCALPRDHRWHHDWAITVEDRGNNRWAVTRYRRCLDADGNWDYEPIPSERDDEWLDTHRFDLDTALRLATEAAPHVDLNG